jgi:hypothetical protein
MNAVEMKYIWSGKQRASISQLRPQVSQNNLLINYNQLINLRMSIKTACYSSTIKLTSDFSISYKLKIGFGLWITLQYKINSKYILYIWKSYYFSYLQSVEFAVSTGNKGKNSLIHTSKLAWFWTEFSIDDYNLINIVQRNG